jgi:lysophospholipase L1-like esterase
VAETPRGAPVRRYVALGDSLTEGVGDPVRGGLRGWAVLLADGLAGASPALEVTNLARRGATAATVRREQLPRALDLRPDLVTLLVGVNDVTTPGAFTPERFAADLETCVRQCRAAGARVVTARLHDPVARLPLPRGVAEGVRLRVDALNTVVTDVAARHGALLVDLGAHPEVRDRSTWSPDRLHPGEVGHRLLAAAVADLLRADGVAVAPVPLRPPPGEAGTGARGHLLWLLRDGGPWFLAQQVRAVRAARTARRSRAGSRR